MRKIGIREFKERTSEILRQVRENGDSYEVTYHGRPIAQVIPVRGAQHQTPTTDFWWKWEELAQEIGASWPEGVSAVEAAREGRRDL